MQDTHGGYEGSELRASGCIDHSKVSEEGGGMDILVYF